MKPTFYLRYIESKYDRSRPMCCLYGYGEEKYSELQQWWEDEIGNGEWRFIEVDFSCENKPPY